MRVVSRWDQQRVGGCNPKQHLHCVSGRSHAQSPWGQQPQLCRHPDASWRWQPELQRQPLVWQDATGSTHIHKGVYLLQVFNQCLLSLEKVTNSILVLNTPGKNLLVLCPLVYYRRGWHVRCYLRACSSRGPTHSRPDRPRGGLHVSCSTRQFSVR